MRWRRDRRGLVVGTPNKRFAEQVTAVVQTRHGEVRRPRSWASSPAGRTPSGKAGYRWAKAYAIERLGLG